MSTGVSGTQSPPLEATGEDVPMGASSVDGGPEDGGPVEAVPDSVQRKQYFEGSKDAPSKAEKAAQVEIGKKTSDKSEQTDRS